MIAGGALLVTAGIATGHIVMAVIGGLLLLAAGHACVRVLRARRRARPENDIADGNSRGYPEPRAPYAPASTDETNSITF